MDMRRDLSWSKDSAQNAYFSPLRTHQCVHCVQVEGGVVLVDVHDVDGTTLLMRQADIIVTCTTAWSTALHG